FAPLELDMPKCDEQYVHGVELARFTGAGRMVRMWFGAWALDAAEAKNEILRIYVDDDPKPIVDVLLRSALDGSAGEMFAPPFGVGSVGRMGWYYPVAFQKKLVVALDQLGDLHEYWFHCDAVMSRDPASVVHVDRGTRAPERDKAKAFLSANAAAGPHDTLLEPATVQLAASQ